MNVTSCDSVYRGGLDPPGRRRRDRVHGGGRPACRGCIDDGQRDRHGRAQGRRRRTLRRSPRPRTPREWSPRASDEANDTLAPTGCLQPSGRAGSTGGEACSRTSQPKCQRRLSTGNWPTGRRSGWGCYKSVTWTAGDLRPRPRDPSKPLSSSPAPPDNQRTSLQLLLRRRGGHASRDLLGPGRARLVYDYPYRV